MAMTFPGTEIFRIDGATVDPSRNLISNGDNETTVEPKVMAVLCFLAANAGKVVSRNAIIDAVWGVAYGGDESLTRAVSLLRKALPGKIIQTIPKRGYCLATPPQSLIEPAAPLPPSSARRSRSRHLGFGLAAVGILLAIAAFVFSLMHPASPTSRISGIVVLVKALGNEPSSPDAEVAADSLTASLARFDQIKVRRYQPGMTVDTQTAYVYVVTTTLTAENSTRRLRVQLQDYRSKDALWSGDARYTAPLDKAISALSAELKLATLQAAKTEVQNKPVENLSPWELILLGTWVPGADREWQGPPTADSYWIWERAIEKDPDFALAHASLAQVMANFALFDPPSDTTAHSERAARSADRALALAPYDAGVLFQIALYYRYAGKRDEAVATLKRVIDIEPDNIMARIELAYVTGQCSIQSADAIRRLKALDASLPPASPAHWVIASHMADISLARGDYAQARLQAAQSRHIVRQIWSSMTLAAADAELGNTAEANELTNEHKGQWPALNYTRFADTNLTRWCVGGDTTHARDAFLKLGRAVASK